MTGSVDPAAAGDGSGNSAARPSIGTTNTPTTPQNSANMSAIRASCSQLASSSTAAHRRQACMPSTSGRVAVHTPAAAAAAAPRHARHSLLRRQAVKNEEAELDRIARQAGQADIWDSELVGNAVKVLLVAGIVAVAVFIGRLGEPMVENTIKSFPTPAEYEAYEESR